MRSKAPSISLWTVLISLTFLINGCIVVPVDYHTTGSRENINEHTAERIVVGTTTRREVLLELGEPEHRSEDGSHIGYAWSKVRALIIYAAYYAAGAEEITKNHVLEIHFDEAGIVTKVELKSKWLDPVEIDGSPTQLMSTSQPPGDVLVVPFELVGFLDNPAPAVQLSVIDRRKGHARTSTRTAAFGINMGTVKFVPDEAELIERSIGNTLAETGTIQKQWTAHLKEFRVYTDTGVLSWNIICLIDIELHDGQNSYSLTTIQEKRTYIWPTEDLVREVVIASLENIHAQTLEAIK